MSDVTRILEAAHQGDAHAADQLLPLVYGELRRLAAHKMANEASAPAARATVRSVGQIRPGLGVEAEAEKAP